MSSMRNSRARAPSTSAVPVLTEEDTPNVAWPVKVLSHSARNWKVL
jgi:hypothetical protein